MFKGWGTEVLPVPYMKPVGGLTVGGQAKTSQRADPLGHVGAGEHLWSAELEDSTLENTISSHAMGLGSEGPQVP